MLLGSGIDVHCTKRKLQFARLLQDKWGSVQTATGLRDCGYGRTTDTGTSELWVWVYFGATRKLQLC